MQVNSLHAFPLPSRLERLAQDVITIDTDVPSAAATLVSIAVALIRVSDLPEDERRWLAGYLRYEALGLDTRLQ